MHVDRQEAVLQQLERVIEQSHRLQLELLRLHREMLGSDTRANLSPLTTADPSGAPEAIELPDQPTFSVSEAAALLGVSRDTVYQCAGSGEISSLRLGRRLLIPRAALAQMLSPREAGSVGPRR